MAYTLIYADSELQAGFYGMINKEAVFSDGSIKYVQPKNPLPGDEAVIMLRTGRDFFASVELVLFADNIDESLYIHMKETDYSTECNSRSGVAEEESRFKYYNAKIKLSTKTVRYCFLLRDNDQTLFYDRVGFCEEKRPEKAFTLIPGFSVPDWSIGAVMYQIYTDRFCNGTTSNDVCSREYRYLGTLVNKIDDWNEYPKESDVFNFYGGDLVGVRKQLDYLQSLGIEVLYFNPLFVSPSNHKYDCQDYDHIDPHLCLIPKDGGAVLGDGDNYGDGGDCGDATCDNTKAWKYILRTTDKTNLEAADAYFADLVNEIHKRGMKIVMDGVFNHCGSFHKWMDRERIYEHSAGYAPGAYVSAESPYRHYFRFGNENGWPYNGTYEGWWNHDTLPKLNYDDCHQLRAYIREIGQKWVLEPFYCDGWRLDVAADLGHTPEVNHGFWRDFRSSVKNANPDTIIYAEHYGDASSWLKGNEWDTVMNYDAFMEPVTWFLTGMEKHSDEYREDLLNNDEYFVGAMRENMAKLPFVSMMSAMNELSNHGHSRFLTRTNKKVGRVATLGSEAASEDVSYTVMAEASVMLFTWPGSPTVYYGDEVGVCGFTDPDSRRTYPWGRENIELLKLYKELSRIHRDYEVLKTGSFMFLEHDTGFMSYARFDDRDQIVVLVNNLDIERDVEISVWRTGFRSRKMVSLMVTDKDGFRPQAFFYHNENGKIKVHMKPEQAIILKSF